MVKEDSAVHLTTLDYILDIISEGVWDWNIVTGHVARSPGWYTMLGYPVNGLNQDVLTWERVIHPEDLQRVMQHFEAYVNGQSDRYCIQYRCIKYDGSPLWIEDSGQIVERTPQGDPIRMIGAHTNIDDLKVTQAQLYNQSRILKGEFENLEQIIEERTQELELLNRKLAEKVDEIEYIASRDPLTGIFNRRMFEQLLDIEIKRAKRYSQPMCVILADLDFFKEVNDQYGHTTGDKVLLQVAQTLKRLIRESDLIARWGGEEFAIILPNTESETALEMAERLRFSIANQILEEKIQLTCSFGVTKYIPDDSGDSIFARMDQALYQAKGKNRNNVQLFTVS